MATMVPLSQLVTGQKAEIGQLTGRPDNVRRLAEMGLACGTALEMIRSGSPCIIGLGGDVDVIVLCLRRSGPAACYQEKQEAEDTYGCFHRFYKVFVCYGGIVFQCFSSLIPERLKHSNTITLKHHNTPTPYRPGFCSSPLILTIHRPLFISEKKMRPL